MSVNDGILVKAGDQTHVEQAGIYALKAKYQNFVKRAKASFCEQSTSKLFPSSLVKKAENQL